MTNRDAVRRAVEASFVKAEAHYNRTFIRPRIIFLQKGRTAGTACSSTWVLDFNEALLNHQLDAFLARTVPHEVAHLVDYKVNNGHERTGTGRRRVHGNNWKKVMRVLEVKDSTRCHSYDTSMVQRRKRRKVATVDYCCKDCLKTIPLTTIRHKKALRGRVYSHKCSEGRGVLVLMRDFLK